MLKMIKQNNQSRIKLLAMVSITFLFAGSIFVQTTQNLYAQDPQNYVNDIVKLAKENTDFRYELSTANHTQVVLMSLKPGEDIGMEIHKHIDQILVFVAGSGEADINGQKIPIKTGDLALVPAGTPHDFTNTGNTDLKLYTTYSPPNHYAGTIQKTKDDTKGYVPMGDKIEIEG